jgi:ADP-ribose pyrophosphatase YjhB (NUDIX family)
MGVFLHEGRLLVTEYREPSRVYYRLPGGSIEFGEHSHQAIVREIREELHAEITDVRLIGTLESIWPEGHEIVQVYAARFIDEAIYQRYDFMAVEQNGEPLHMKWVLLEQFADDLPLYPNGLFALLQTTFNM